MAALAGLGGPARRYSVSSPSRPSASTERCCLCDPGKRFPEERRTDLAIGGRHAAFRWCGRYWFCPSDLGNPVGGPFARGIRTFEVRGVGTWNGSARQDDSFEVVAERELVE